MGIGTYISIITLNVNGLKAPTKRHRLAEWIQNKTHIYVSTKDPLQTQRHIQTESKGMEKDILGKWKAKESWSSNSYIRKIHFKIKTIRRVNEGHYIMIKGLNQEDDVTIVNIYAPNIGVPQYIRQY